MAPNLLGKRSLWQRIKEIALTDVGVLARGVDVIIIDTAGRLHTWPPPSAARTWRSRSSGSNRPCSRPISACP